MGSDGDASERRAGREREAGHERDAATERGAAGATPAEPTETGPPDAEPPEGPVERYAITPDASEEEFLAAAKLYAREVVDRHDLSVDVAALEWDVSKRAKRRAGVVRHVDGEPESLALTWEHFTEHGWAAAAATVRHELVHVHRLNEAGDGGHGEAFRRLAAELDAPIHCERFAEPKYWVVCTDCGAEIARYRRSKLVEQPGAYRCADCGGAFRVEAND